MYPRAHLLQCGPDLIVLLPLCLLLRCSRFQPVTVPEPSIEETYEILQVSSTHVAQQ